MSAERWRSSRVCVGLHSAPVRRSFDKEIGATRVVVVIFSPCRGLRKARRICGVLRGSGGNGLGSFCENELEEAKKFANLRTSDDEGGQEAQSKVVGAIDYQTLTQSFGSEWVDIDGELDAEDETFAADFADEVEFGGEPGEAFAELGAASANVFEEFVFFDDVKKFESGGANQRTATERGAMQP